MILTIINATMLIFLLCLFACMFIFSEPKGVIYGVDIISLEKQVKLLQAILRPNYPGAPSALRSETLNAIYDILKVRPVIKESTDEKFILEKVAKR